MNKDLLYLPEHCYALLPQSGELVTITRGSPGYRHSPLDRGNRPENRIIADRENAALSGVTAEQEKDMVDGAILGWEIILYRNGALLPKDKTLQVEISNDGPKSYETSVTLELPATWAEFNDALQRARVKDPRHCSNEVLYSQFQEFPKHCIAPNVDILELNLLAQRLAMLTEEQKSKLGDLLKLEQVKSYGAIPLSTLINLTYSTEQCCVVLNASTHLELGRILWENEILPDEIMTILDKAEPDSEYLDTLLEVFGKKHMEDEGGVFTSRGYMELHGTIQEIYTPGEMAHFQRSGTPVVLQVRKGLDRKSVV